MIVPSLFSASRSLCRPVARSWRPGSLTLASPTLLAVVEYLIPEMLGEKVMPVRLPSIVSVTAMLQATENLSALFNSGIGALYFGLILLLCLVLIRMLVALNQLPKRAGDCAGIVAVALNVNPLSQ